MSQRRGLLGEHLAQPGQASEVARLSDQRQYPPTFQEQRVTPIGQRSKIKSATVQDAQHARGVSAPLVQQT